MYYKINQKLKKDNYPKDIFTAIAKNKGHQMDFNRKKIFFRLYRMMGGKICQDFFYLLFLWLI
jgi:hypothetical protein